MEIDLGKLGHVNRWQPVEVKYSANLTWHTEITTRLNSFTVHTNHRPRMLSRRNNSHRRIDWVSGQSCVGACAGFPSCCPKSHPKMVSRYKKYPPEIDFFFGSGIGVLARGQFSLALSNVAEVPLVLSAELEPVSSANLPHDVVLLTGGSGMETGRVLIPMQSVSDAEKEGPIEPGKHQKT